MNQKKKLKKEEKSNCVNIWLPEIGFVYSHRKLKK